MDAKSFLPLLKERLSETRYNHSLKVAESAVFLAKKYGANEQKAELAGFLHDICKETDEDSQLKIFNRFDIMLSNVEKKEKKLWHAISGAAVVKYELLIDDSDVINAVRYHTTGRAGMSLLEKVIYIADYISEDRNYNGVEEMRQAAEASLEQAMEISLIFSIKELVKKGKCIHADTVDAYNELKLKV